MENSGWRTKGKQIVESDQMYPGLEILSIKSGEDEQATVVKSFNIPIDFPFDVSDNPFEIRYNEDMFNDHRNYLKNRRNMQIKRTEKVRVVSE